ncbi:MAG: hypothetical protein ACJZ38_04115 [Candidatus Pelagibacterales bacterium]
MIIPILSMKLLEKNDKLNSSSETLVGSKGFVPIQVNEISEDINLVY